MWQHEGIMLELRRDNTIYYFEVDLGERRSYTSLNKINKEYITMETYDV